MAKATKKLTPKQIQTLIFIQAYCNETCCMPSFGDIADHLKTCRSNAFELVDKIIDKGYLTSTGCVRGLEFTNKANRFMEDNNLVYLTTENLPNILIKVD